MLMEKSLSRGGRWSDHEFPPTAMGWSMQGGRPGHLSALRAGAGTGHQLRHLWVPMTRNMAQTGRVASQNTGQPIKFGFQLNKDNC